MVRLNYPLGVEWMLSWSMILADFRGDEVYTCNDKSGPLFLRCFCSSTTVWWALKCWTGADIPHQKLLAWILACSSQWEAARRLDHQPAGLGKVHTGSCFLSIFICIAPQQLSATQAVLQLHPRWFAIFLHRHSILAVHKINVFLEVTVYSLKTPCRTETSEKGKQTVLFHVTPIINIPVLAKHS